jgi:ribonuclease D
MEVLWYTCGKIIPNLIDTQICSALLGYPAQIGYAGLAADLVNADIAKSQTRTDWSRRPLTDAQLHYAAEDVEHLTQMHEILKRRLNDLGRYEWALEDSRGLCNTDLYKPAPDKAWQRLKSIPFLPAEQQARARALAVWREQRAVTVDKPRGWILSDKALLQLAERNPETLPSLEDIEALPHGVIRNQGKKLLAILVEANRALAAGDVSYQQISPDRDKDKALGKKLSAIVRATAEELEIANEVLGSKRDIQALISGNGSSRIMSGWRYALIGEAMLAEIPPT